MKRWSSERMAIEKWKHCIHSYKSVIVIETLNLYSMLLFIIISCFNCSCLFALYIGITFRFSYKYDAMAFIRFFPCAKNGRSSMGLVN